MLDKQNSKYLIDILQRTHCRELTGGGEHANERGAWQMNVESAGLEKKWGRF